MSSIIPNFHGCSMTIMIHRESYRNQYYNMINYELHMTQMVIVTVILRIQSPLAPSGPAAPTTTGSLGCAPHSQSAVAGTASRHQCDIILESTGLRCR